MKFFGFGGKGELPAKDELSPKDQEMMEIKKPEERKGFAQFLFDPNTMQDKVRKEENGLVLLDNVNLYAVTPGMIDKQGGAPSHVKILMTEKQYNESCATEGRTREMHGLVKSTDERASLATPEALGMTAHPKLAPEIEKYLDEGQNKNVEADDESPEKKKEIPV